MFNNYNFMMTTKVDFTKKKKKVHFTLQKQNNNKSPRTEARKCLQS